MTLAAPTFGDGSVVGTISYDGPAPAERVVGESDACGEVMDESLVVSTDGGLANVLVYLEGEIGASTGAEQPAKELDQNGCRFVPRVQGIQVDQPLIVTNGDPMRHNVRYTPENNERQNLVFATGGQEQRVTFDRPEPEPIVVKCDIHPWMAAYVGVFDHPFFTATDSDGRFELDRVPAGEYEVVAWHELLGERRGTVTVADAGTVELPLEYARN